MRVVAGKVRERLQVSPGVSDDELRVRAEKLVKSGYATYLLGLLAG